MLLKGSTIRPAKSIIFNAYALKWQMLISSLLFDTDKKKDNVDLFALLAAEA